MSKLRLHDYEQSNGTNGDYDARLAALHLRLQQVQTAYITHGLRGVVVLEGWDAAGKGGAIRRLTEPLDPRFYHVWPISAPDEHEQREHYMARFWRRLPRKGQMSIFDRSWYGRVLVERVEGFAKPADWQRAYGEINAFEAALVADGHRIIKLFLHITEQEQQERLLERLAVPFKRWKTGADDYRNRAKRSAYEQAIHAMFDETHSKQAPWVVIAANKKKSARLAVLEAVAEALSKGVDLANPAPDPAVVALAEQAFGAAAVKAAMAAPKMNGG
jgi:polyphosphate kinase 2 (PPK2 family)